MMAATHRRPGESRGPGLPHVACPWVPAFAGTTNMGSIWAISDLARGGAPVVLAVGRFGKIHAGEARGDEIAGALRHGQKDREIPEYAKAKDASLERCPGVGEHDEATLDAMCNQHLSEEDRDDSDEENRDPGCRRRVRDPRGAACLPSMARESMGSNGGTLRRE